MKKLVYSTLVALSCSALNAASSVRDFQEFVKSEKAQKDFDSLIKGPKPVVVKFFAPWCGPCKATVALFEELATKHSHQAQFITIDVTKFNIGNTYGVKTVPTFFIFHKGEEIAKCKRGDLVETIEKELKRLS